MALLNNDIVRIEARGQCFGQQIILTHHYKCVGDAPAVNTIIQDLTQILTDLDLAGVLDLRTPYLACLPASYTLDKFRAQRIRATRSAYVDKLQGNPGTNINMATVANDSGAITLRSQTAGRGHYCTKHIGPVPDAASVNGLLTNAYKNLLGALANKLITSFIPAGLGTLLVPVVYNAKLFTSDFVVMQIVGAESRVQRRRTVGLGK